MTGPLRCLVVDDEATARKRLRRLLSGIDGIELAGECESAERMLVMLEDEDIDVILLDVQMSGMSGIDARTSIPEDGPYVIFTTAHAEHAVRAFEVGAVDFVLKPIDETRLGVAITRAKQHYEKRPARSTEPLPRLPIETRQGIVLVAPDDVTHAVLEGALVTVHVADGASARAYVTTMPLAELEKRTCERLERVHRKALVSFAHVTRLEPQPTGGYLAHMKLGGSVEVSRQSARRIRRRLGIG